MTDTPISAERLRQMSMGLPDEATVLMDASELRALCDMASRALSPPGLREAYEDALFIAEAEEADCGSEASLYAKDAYQHGMWERARKSCSHIAQGIRSRLSALPESGGAADKTNVILDKLWEQDHGYDMRLGLSYCERCEEDGGAQGRDQPWRNVPHSDNCIYSLALSAPSPDALAQERAGETAASKVADAVRELAATKSGHELHRAVDALFCDTMRALGYNEAADVFLEAIGEAHRT